MESPLNSLLLGVIQRSNEIIMDDKQPIFGRQSVSLPNFLVAEDIVHLLPNFVATWNPPIESVLPGDYSVYIGGRFSKVSSSRGIPASYTFSHSNSTKNDQDDQG